MSAIDPHSSTWKAVAAWVSDGISKSRAALEVHGASLETTEFHRGRIAALNEFLKLNAPSKINPAHSADPVE